MFGRKSYREQQIHQEIKNGNTAILIYLFEKNYVSARNYIMQFQNASENDVNDTLEEAILAYWQKERQPGFTHQFKMQRTIMKYLREKWAYKIEQQEETIALHEEMEAGTNPEEIKTKEEIYQEKVNLIEGYLGYLSNSCRQILQYTYFDRLTDEEISRKMDLSPTEIEEKKTACLQQLDQAILDNHSMDELI